MLIKNRNAISVDISLIECDYYDYLDGDKNSEKLFLGEYMSQYSWGESTLATLINYNT